MPEKKNQFIEHDGKYVGFRDMPDGQRFIQVRKRDKEKKPDVCPLCKEVFAEENVTAVVLVISNQVGVPNRFVHKECMSDMTLEYAFRSIVEDWKVAKEKIDWLKRSGWNA